MEKQIELPALPASWDQLTDTQMEQLNMLRHEYGQSRERFLYQAFCYLLSLRITDRMDEKDDGWVYWFERLDQHGNPGQEQVPLQSWQIQFYIDKMLAWLCEDCTRLMPVFQNIELGGRKYAGPGYAMAGMTYQQHQFAQRYMVQYQTQLQQYRQKQEAEMLQEIEQTRRRLMATIYTPQVLITSKLVDGRQVNYDPPLEESVFTTAQIEREAHRFKDFSIYQSEAVIQHFQGVMLHYRKLYPLLFKEGGGAPGDFIQVEESTLNALQNELHFANYQTIYDSNAPFILGKLHAIMQKAKAMEEAHLKSKARIK